MKINSASPLETCVAAPPPAPPPPLPPGIAQVTASYSADFSAVDLTIGGNVDSAALSAFVQDFKLQVSKTWGIPLDKVVVKSVTVNGKIIAVSRRRSALEDSYELGEAARVLLEPLRGMGLTRLVQVGQEELATVESIAALQAQEAALLALLASPKALRSLGTHNARRSIAAGDSASLDFSVTQIIEVPLPPSPPPNPPNAPGPVAPGAAASNLVGAPSRQVLKVSVCQPTQRLSLAWVPEKFQGPRFVMVSFDSPPTVASVEGVAVYLLNIGRLSPVITSIQLMVIPSGQVKARSVTVFNSSTAAAPSLVCPGISRFAVSGRAASLAAGLTIRKFNTAVVQSVRIDFDGSAVPSVGGLPYVAAVGLVVA
ncbi:hypothetical protein TSOC_004889 [Tetrabaena socialis]|uniref:Uncharacterized protein n=1 Tax=Tetrabaena socialis TaxID=47790 RepID=A0A2J8A7R9_9CHLO|nr:hypothetical protein TSOC_004889 [Tetrabaena socialis]|eukprot:PNH08530.1 hypothetical protein TSOC_004889 [Tetrabaena socialis]